MTTTFRTGLVFTAALVLLGASAALAGDDQGPQVVITHPGVVFHKAGAHDVRGHAVARSTEAALEAGYTPCPVCFAKEIAATPKTPAPPGAASTAAFGQAAAPTPVVAPKLQPTPELTGSRFASRVAATGCSPGNEIVCPYGLPFRTIPGL